MKKIKFYRIYRKILQEFYFQWDNNIFHRKLIHTGGFPEEKLVIQSDFINPREVCSNPIGIKFPYEVS